MDVLYPQHFQLSATQIASAAREFIASQQWLHDNDHVGCYHVGNNHLVWLVATDSVHIAQLPAYYSSILSKLHKHLTQVLGGDHLNVHLCYQQSLKHKTDPKHSPTCYIASWERGVGRTESCGSGAVAASICHREWQLQHSTQDSGTPSKPVPITFVGDHADQWLMVQTTYEPNLTESDQPNNQGYLAHITGTATYIGQIQTELSPPHG